MIWLKVRFTSLALMTLFVVVLAISNTASASRYYGNHCGSSSTPEQSAYCNSSLGEYTYDLIDDGVSYSTNAAHSSISIDGINVALSAWSDTVGTYNDDVVTQASLVHISNNYGYGVYNADHEYYGSNPDHAIDNINTLSYNVSPDFDYVLLSFSESVKLTGASFSWIGNSYDTQVSIAGLHDISTLTSGVNTWSDIVQDALTAGSYDVTNCDYVDHRADFTESSSSKYWLIGAYNTVFGDIGGSMYNDAFKITALGFEVGEQANQPPTNVSEPKTWTTLAAFGLFIAWRRKTNYRRI